jgi:hypothetical protein
MPGSLVLGKLAVLPKHIDCEASLRTPHYSEPGVAYPGAAQSSLGIIRTGDQLGCILMCSHQSVSVVR